MPYHESLQIPHAISPFRSHSIIKISKAPSQWLSSLPTAEKSPSQQKSPRPPPPTPSTKSTRPNVSVFQLPQTHYSTTHPPLDVPPHHHLSQTQIPTSLVLRRQHSNQFRLRLRSPKPAIRDMMLQPVESLNQPISFGSRACVALYSLLPRVQGCLMLARSARFGKPVDSNEFHAPPVKSIYRSKQL